MKWALILSSLDKETGRDLNSLSHVCEQHDYKDTSKLKYWVNLYKVHGEKAFINRENGIYRKDTKLLAIGRVKNSESIRSVAVDLGLIEPGILSDQISKYNIEGEESIQDTYPRKSYLSKDEKYKDNEIKELKEENYSLKNALEFWKDKFFRVISLVKKKLFGHEKERKKYYDVSKDLYSKGIIKEDTFEELKDTYIFSKEHDSIQKGEDDFDMKI